MKISDHSKSAEMDGQVKKSLKKSGVSNGEPPAAAPLKGPERASGGDNVTLSAKARDIHEIQRSLDTVPDVRKEKVAEIKGRIESGTYSVKGEAVADGIIKASVIDRIV